MASETSGPISITASMVNRSSSPNGACCVSVFSVSMLMRSSPRYEVTACSEPLKSVPCRNTRRHREVSGATSSRAFRREPLVVGRTFTVNPGISSATRANARRSSGDESAKDTSIITLKSCPSLAMRVFSTFPPASSTVFARELTSPGRSGPYAVMIAFSALANGSSCASCVAKPRKPRVAGGFVRKGDRSGEDRHAACLDDAGISHPRDAARRTARNPARSTNRARSRRCHISGAPADVEVMTRLTTPELVVKFSSHA